MDHTESYLRNHDLPAPDAEHFKETKGGYREVSCDSLYNVDFLKGISHPILLSPQLTSISEVTSGTIDVPTQPPIELHTIHHVFLFCLYMIRMKEKRDLFVK